MSDPFTFPGMSHVPPAERPRPAAKPCPPAPSRDDRRIALEVAAAWLNGTNESNTGFIKAADQIAHYLHGGEVPPRES